MFTCLRVFLPFIFDQLVTLGFHPFTAEVSAYTAITMRVTLLFFLVDVPRSPPLLESFPLAVVPSCSI